MKRILRQVLLILITLLFLASCSIAPSDSPVQTAIAKTQQVQVKKLPASLSYSVINMESGSSPKCILDVRIPNLISKDEIKQIAEYIKENEGKYCSPLYIYYFLPDTNPGVDSAWAYSNFNPGLELKINGINLETIATLVSSTPKVGGNVIGIWLDTWGLSRTITITKTNDSYQMTTLYGDGSGETKTLGVQVVNGEERLFENPDNFYGDYMVIMANGKLAFFDKQGFIYDIEP
jgi:hypothetical protein